MLPTLIIFTGCDTPQLENRLRSLFVGNEDIRFLTADGSGTKAADTDTLLKEMKQSYAQIMGEWDRLQFKQNTSGRILLKELFFFFFTDLADPNQAEIFFKSVEFLKAMSQETDFFPISFGGLLTIPEPLADSTRKAVFYESLLRLNTHLRDSTLLLRPRLLLLSNPVITSSGMDAFVQEVESFLTAYLRNDSVQADLDNFQRSGCQLQPLDKESPFSVMKWAQIQYDIEKVFTFLCNHLVQKLIDERLAHLQQPTNDETKDWFEGYAERIRSIAKMARQCWSGALDSDKNDSEDPALELILKNHLKPPQQNHAMTAELMAFDQFILKRYHQEIDERQSFDNGLELLRYYVSLEESASQGHSERQQNISAMSKLILEHLEDDNYIGQYLQKDIFSSPETSLMEPWWQHLPETLEILRDWMKKSSSLNEMNSSNSSVNLPYCQTKFVLSLLETLGEWPVRPDKIIDALKTLTQDFTMAYTALKQKKIAIENDKEELQKEMESLRGRGVIWKILHAAEFNKMKKGGQEKSDQANTELDESKQQISSLIDDMYSPWLRVGARWHFVLSQIALATTALKYLTDRETEQLMSLRNVAQDAKMRCDEIVWLETPPQIDLVCKKESERILDYDEQQEGDFYAAWRKFPTDQPEYSGEPYAQISQLSHFTDGKMPICISKLSAFAAFRFARYKVMDLPQIVGIIGENRLRVLLGSTMKSLSPWMILDHGRSQALDTNRPKSICLMESATENHQLLIKNNSDQSIQIQYIADQPHTINMLHFTCGVPAFVLTGIARNRLAWHERHQHNDGNTSDISMDELIPEQFDKQPVMTCIDSANPSPSHLFPVPVVRAIVQDSAGRLLLLKRSNTRHGNESWCLPGGKIDYGQTIEDALASELLEETSLHLVSADFFFFQNSLPLNPGGMHCINLYFICRMTGDLRLNDESSEFLWMDSADIDHYDIVFRNDEAIRRFFYENK